MEGESEEKTSGLIKYLKVNTITLNEEQIKKMLIEIQEPCRDFSVFISKKKPRTRMGSYSGGKITLFLPYFSNNNELIRTAIHEYAHHQWREGPAHGKTFYLKYFELLESADKKGFYSLNIESSRELKSFAEFITNNKLVQNRLIYKEYAWLLRIIYSICRNGNANFKYYITKYLEIPWHDKICPHASYRSLFQKAMLSTCKYDTFDILKKKIPLKLIMEYAYYRP